jgi:5-hmdU DNA kinase-like protein
MSLAVWIRRKLPRPTTVFDTYWRFAAERQDIFRQRLLGNLWTTGDPILRRFRFTNAYRASDRTSQFLIRSVLYDANWSWRDSFLRSLLFKLFNRIETWELLAAHLGAISAAGFDVNTFEGVLDHAIARGESIYSAAYIIPPASSFGERRKHSNHLRFIARLLTERVDERVAGCRSLRDVYNTLLAQPSLGPFLAYQFAIDLNYGPHLAFSEGEFVVPGPGARDGLAKCFSSFGDLTPEDVIRWTVDTQEAQFAERGVQFDDLWGRPLQLIDCQNLYCEVSKYARVAHPEFLGVAGRVRIKQRFAPRTERLSAWYPPKWGLNAKIRRWLEPSPV